MQIIFLLFSSFTAGTTTTITKSIVTITGTTTRTTANSISTGTTLGDSSTTTYSASSTGTTAPVTKPTLRRNDTVDETIVETDDAITTSSATTRTGTTTSSNSMTTTTEVLSSDTTTTSARETLTTTVTTDDATIESTTQLDATTVVSVVETTKTGTMVAPIPIPPSTPPRHITQHINHETIFNCWYRNETKRPLSENTFNEIDNDWELLDAGKSIRICCRLQTLENVIVNFVRVVFLRDSVYQKSQNETDRLLLMVKEENQNREYEVERINARFLSETGGGANRTSIGPCRRLAVFSDRAQYKLEYE
jgi:hypothetical protein